MVVGVGVGVGVGMGLMVVRGVLVRGIVVMLVVGVGRIAGRRGRMRSSIGFWRSRSCPSSTVVRLYDSSSSVSRFECVRVPLDKGTQQNGSLVVLVWG